MCWSMISTQVNVLCLLCVQCLLELQNEAVFMWTTELENLATLCFKALEGSNYGVRVAVAKLLGTVMATALMPKQAAGGSNVPSQSHFSYLNISSKTPLQQLCNSVGTRTLFAMFFATGTRHKVLS